MTEDGQRLTLEEMLALAKKITFWSKAREFNHNGNVQRGWYKGINLVISALPRIYGRIHYEMEANYNNTPVGFASCTEHWAVDGASGEAIPPEKETFSTIFSWGGIPRKVVPPENEGIITQFKETYPCNRYTHEEEWTREEKRYVLEAKALAQEAMK
jgi:hypothetical protein